ncbi:hypothetical protein EAS64_33640 [Trebonia kvetii]|uniref:PD-(D/E)XK endonuclease-like domain-containing protein n=1 Tax=Trebonia kvetii TaxID=2480626 RepID=A0A6P2BQD7_9ACTN|nr:PD-(D/E)XK nuclease family protein [Trebonia kvetii]TVZ01224.1 hypothetical protein EAS64_33640 [Trebonia kvetii]
MPSDFDVEAVFAEEFTRAIAEESAKSGYRPDQFQLGGRWNDQGEDFWRENGPQWAANFIHWYERQTDVGVWIAPDGRPAIELDLTADFGDVPVRGVIDLVLTFGKVNPALVVTDIKSGSTYPDSARQLAIGAGLIEQNFGIRPRYGAFFMARGTGRTTKTYFQPVIEMDGAANSVPYLGGEFAFFDLSANSGNYPAHPGDHCRRCPVAHACVERGGHEAARYDPNYPTPLRRTK